MTNGPFTNKQISHSLGIGHKSTNGNHYITFLMGMKPEVIEKLQYRTNKQIS